MKNKLILLVSLILYLWLGGCSGLGLLEQQGTADAIAELQSAGDAVQAPFSLDDLSGIFTYINYRCQGGESCQSIGISNPDWSATTVITSHNVGMAMFPIWSPDGRYIAYPFFEMEQGFYNEIRLFDFKKKREIVISSEPIYGEVDSLTWAPDNSNLVFALSEGRDDSELFSLNINKGELENLSSSPDSLDKNPAWSPTGEAIAFDSDRGGTFDIWTISPSGEELSNLSGSEGEAYRDIKSSWSPDGSQIAFYRFDKVSAGLWLMNADGSDQQMLIELGNLDYVETPVWSPSGEWIALIARGNPLSLVWLIKPSTGEIFQASAEPGRYGYLSWAPNSSAVAYLEDIRTTGIPLVHLHSVDGSYHDAWEAHTKIYYLQWSPVGKLP